MTIAVDVLVVGGGPAGSATSALLARRGWRVALIDRAVFPRAKACGDYVNPGCDALFERLGVRAAVAAAAAPVHGMRLVTAGGQIVPLAFPRRTGWSVPRARLDQVLLHHAARSGVAVHEGCRLVSLISETRGVRATVAHGAHQDCYDARVVIGADGLRSTVARAAGIDAPVRTGRYTVGAYLEGLGESGEWGEIHLRPQGYCGVAHFANGLANVTLAVPRSVLRAWRGRVETGYWSWLDGCLGLRDRLTRARRVGRFTAVGPLGYHRRPVGRGRVLLVGDSAAHADPMTGQGVYLALRGAELCAAAADAALEGSGLPARRAYARARWREFAPVFAASRLVQALAFRRGVVTRAAAQLSRHADLRVRLMDAVGNTAHPAAVLHPAVLARVLGWM
jgi:flavin-dependent dehydrogenase